MCCNILIHSTLWHIEKIKSPQPTLYLFFENLSFRGVGGRGLLPPPPPSPLNYISYLLILYTPQIHSIRFRVLDRVAVRAAEIQIVSAAASAPQIITPIGAATALRGQPPIVVVAVANGGQEYAACHRADGAGCVAVSVKPPCNGVAPLACLCPRSSCGGAGVVQRRKLRLCGYAPAAGTGGVCPRCGVV